MPYFVAYALDAPNGADLRAKHRPAHRARLRDLGHHQIKVHIGGPMTNDLGEMNGSMLVIEAASSEDVLRFVKADPYIQVGLYDIVRVHPFNWGLGEPEEVIYG